MQKEEKIKAAILQADSIGHLPEVPAGNQIIREDDII